MPWVFPKKDEHLREQSDVPLQEGRLCTREWETHPHPHPLRPTPQAGLILKAAKPARSKPTFCPALRKGYRPAFPPSHAIYPGAVTSDRPAALAGRVPVGLGPHARAVETP